MEQENKPAKKFRAGAVSATVWDKAINKDGQERRMSNVSFQKVYKDKDGSWKTTSSLDLRDIPNAIMVLGKAYEFVALKDTAV